MLGLPPFSRPVTRRSWLASAAAMPLGAAAQGGGITRVALVIGNAAYAAAPLVNPVRDAAAVAARLRALGFQVVEERDATRARMGAALQAAAAALRGRDGVGLLYYAGHGLQIDWRNYMLPVDAAITAAADVPAQCMDVQQVLDAFRGAGTRTNVVVLDACRDNPFGAAASGRGLAPLDAPPGTFLAYATAPGNVAEDGDPAAGNGLYTRHLLQALEQPEAPIEELFKRVRSRVRRESGGRQIPWESTSLEDDFAFATGRRIEAQGLGDRDALFQQQRREWEALRDSPRVDDFYAFLQRHPSGVFAELAQAALDRLARPSVVAQVPQALAGLRLLAPGTDRYAPGDHWEFETVNHLAGDSRTRRRHWVNSVHEGRVIVNQGALVMNQHGLLIQNRAGRKDPGVLIAPPDMRVGQRWRSDFYNQPPDSRSAATKNFYDFRVRGIEDLELPFGRVRTFHVVGEGQAIGPSTSHELLWELWIEPETLWWVKQVGRVTPRQGGRPDVHDTTIMVSRYRNAR